MSPRFHRILYISVGLHFIPCGGIYVLSPMTSSPSQHSSSLVLMLSASVQATPYYLVQPFLLQLHSSLTKHVIICIFKRIVLVLCASLCVVCCCFCFYNWSSRLFTPMAATSFFFIHSGRLSAFFGSSQQSTALCPCFPQ